MAVSTDCHEREIYFAVVLYVLYMVLVSLT